MKKVPGMMFAVLTMAATAFAADNTLGTWKYDTAKAPQLSSGSPLKSLTTTRKAVDGGVSTSTQGEREDGSKIDIVTLYTYDGKEGVVKGTGIAWDAIAAKQVDANTITEERWNKGGKNR